MNSGGSDFSFDLQSKEQVASKFCSWLENVVSLNYRYVAATTRRAWNLAEILWEQNPKSLPKLFTENGLMMQAEDIAQIYHHSGQFPPIAILDDILVYGRSINLFLTQFWTLMSQCLSTLDPDVDLIEAERAFNQSITLWFYAVNDTRILLRHEFQWRMRSKEVMPERQWRKLSNLITDYITEEAVANTSYILSAKFEKTSGELPVDLESWRAIRDLHYRRRDQEFSLYLFCRGQKAGVYPSVRSYVKKGVRYYTPYFFMPEVDAEQALSVLQKIFSHASRQDPKTSRAFIALLNRTNMYSARLNVYAQLVYLLLSQVTLSAFFDCALDPQQKQAVVYDSEKIARNFGNTKKIAALLESFCKLTWTQEDLLELIDCLDLPGQSPPSKRQTNHAFIVNTMECFVQAQATDHERDAAKRTLSNFIDSSDVSLVNSAGEQELDRFLSFLRRKTHTSVNVVSMLPILSCLTQMMDQGDLALKARLKWTKGRPIFYSSVRTTEMSLAILPRKLGAYYSVFLLLAEIYWREKDFPDLVENYFRKVVFLHDQSKAHDTEIQNARYLAELVSKNQSIAHSLLNWHNLSDPQDAT